MRHAILAAVVADAVRLVDDNWQCQRNPSTKAQMSRACNWLWDAGALRMAGEGRVVATDYGSELLAMWSMRHPDVGEGR